MAQRKTKNNTYVLVKNANGENVLCPIIGQSDLTGATMDKNEDCFEESVVGRYASNIKIKPS